MAGLVAFACGYGFGRIPGLRPCGDAGNMGAILALEFASTPAGVAGLFGVEPCRSALIAAQRTALWLDALGFIPAYTAFLYLAAWASGGRRRVFVIVLLLIAGILDEVEGALLFTVLRAMPGDAGVLGALAWLVGAKFLLLTTGTLLIGVLLAESRRRLAMIAGAVIWSMGIWAIFRGVPSMVTAFIVSWTALLVLAAIGASWPRLLAPRPPIPATPSA